MTWKLEKREKLWNALHTANNDRSDRNVDNFNGGINTVLPYMGCTYLLVRSITMHIHIIMLKDSSNSIVQYTFPNLTRTIKSKEYEIEICSNILYSKVKKNVFLVLHLKNNDSNQDF